MKLIKFFSSKMRNVGRFLRGKATANVQNGVLNATKEEKIPFLNKKQKALYEQPEAGQDKVIRESGGQDISAI